MARTLVAGFLGALTRHLRLRRTALPALILAAWREHYAGAPPPKLSVERLQGLLRGVAELRKADLNDRQLLTWTRGFDQFTRDMEVVEGGKRKPRVTA
jgi:hypothetical protein